MKKQEKKYVEETATKNFNELIESCENLTINQKRVAFKRIIQDEVEPGEIGALVRQKLSEHLEALDANAGLKLYRLEKEKGNVLLISTVNSYFGIENKQMAAWFYGGISFPILCGIATILVSVVAK